MFRRKCKIIFIRHGSTIYNEQGRLFDAEDYPPITQKGKDEMESLSKWLLNKTPHVDKVFSSSALRSIQSARILAKEYEIDYEIIDGMYDRKSGLWGGLTFEQIEEKYPEMLHQYHANPYEYWPEGGEPTQALRERVSKILKQMVVDNEYKTVVVVTHEDVIQTVIALILGVPPENQGKILIPTGSATQVNFYSSWATLAYCANVPQ